MHRNRNGENVAEISLRKERYLPTACFINCYFFCGNTLWKIDDVKIDLSMTQRVGKAWIIRQNKNGAHEMLLLIRKRNKNESIIIITSLTFCYPMEIALR